MCTKRSVVVCVTGPRDLYDDELTVYAFNELETYYNIIELIHGDATGVDNIASSVMKAKGIKVSSYKADWFKYGKAAGPIRSRAMVNKADVVLVITRNKEPDSPGTSACYVYALRTAPRVYVAWRSRGGILLERRI